METIVSIEDIQEITHDVLQIQTSKPPEWDFKPGQATEVAINQPEWRSKGRPFTFTSLPEDDFLQFTIKTYMDHEGVTQAMRRLDVGNELILQDIFGDISYQGPGLFIAGGAGITPFISIFKALEKAGEVKGNRLLFANKTLEDIILKDWFEQLLGLDFINVLSDEKRAGYESGHVDAQVISKHLQSPQDKVYLCGPEAMMESVQEALDSLNFPAEQCIHEAF